MIDLLLPHPRLKEMLLRFVSSVEGRNNSLALEKTVSNPCLGKRSAGRWRPVAPLRVGIKPRKPRWTHALLPALKRNVLLEDRVLVSRTVSR